MESSPLDQGLELPQELTSCLQNAVPDARLVDEGLQAGPFDADYLLVDGDGRLLLVLVEQESGAPVALRTLDLLAALPHLAQWLPRLLDDAALDWEQAPEVVVVGTGGDPALEERLEVMIGDLRLFMLCEAVTRKASGAWLSEVFLNRGVSQECGPPVAAGLDSTSEERLAFLTDRLTRIDDEVQVEERGGQIRWRVRGALLARARSDQGRLVGWAGSSSEIDLSSTAGVEEFLESCVGRVVDLLEEHSGDEPALQQFEIVPRDPGMTLSSEELDAFRVP
jgi:hypothetical protein